MALVLAFFVLLIVLRWISVHKESNRKHSKNSGADNPEAPPKDGEKLLRCQRCKTYLPSSQLRLGIGGYRCVDPMCARS